MIEINQEKQPKTTVTVQLDKKLFGALESRASEEYRTKASLLRELIAKNCEVQNGRQTAEN